VPAKFNESAKIPGDDWAKMCCMSKKFDESAKTSWFSKNTVCQQKLTVSAKIITHSMTLSVTHFRDAASVMISVTLHRCRFPWRFYMTQRRSCIPWRFPSRFFFCDARQVPFSMTLSMTFFRNHPMLRFCGMIVISACALNRLHSLTTNRSSVHNR